MAARRDKTGVEVCAATAPAVVGRPGDDPGADGVEVNVSCEFPVVALTLDEDAFEAALEEGTSAGLGSVVIGCVGGVEVVHASGEVGMGGAKEEVEMVVHQCPREDAPVASHAHRVEQMEPTLAIRIPPHNAALLQAATSNVVNAVRNVDA